MKKIIVGIGMILLVGMGIKSHNSLETLTGYYLEASEGSHVLIDSEGIPIVMINETKDEKLFDDLSDGDQIEIKYNGIMETFPEQACVYSCKKIKDGEKEDIPEQAISQLSEFGWIDSEKE